MRMNSTAQHYPIDIFIAKHTYNYFSLFIQTRYIKYIFDLKT